MISQNMEYNYTSYVVLVTVLHFISQIQAMTPISSSCISALMSGSYGNCQLVMPDLWGVCEIKDCQDLTTFYSYVGRTCKRDATSIQVIGYLIQLTKWNIIKVKLLKIISLL